MTKMLLRNPYKKEIGIVMSNFGHEIYDTVADELKAKPAFAQYSGWNFCGYLWYDKTKQTYHCEVWRYRSHVETVSGALQDIMEEVSSNYGQD